MDEGRCVLFSGTACQIAGLKQYLGKEYENLFTQDLVCHGVPSPGFWRAYCRKFKEPHQIKDILFRDKSLGWFSGTVSVVYDNGEKVIDDGQYLNAFLKGMLMRESCYQCQYKGYERESDLTLSDCWGWSRVAPQYNPRKGISSVLIHSAKGKQLFDTISGKLMFTEVSPEIALLDNEAAFKSSARSAKREFILGQYKSSNIDELLASALRDPLYKRLVLKFLNENQKQKIHRLIKRIRR